MAPKKSTNLLSKEPSVDEVDDGLRELEKDYVLQSSQTTETMSEKREPSLQFDDAESFGAESINASMETVALKALHVDDDTTLNPWTFRVFFLGGSSFDCFVSSGACVLIVVIQVLDFRLLGLHWLQSFSLSRKVCRSP